jgi:hypothetical protein
MTSARLLPTILICALGVTVAFAQKPTVWRNKELAGATKVQSVLILPSEVQWLHSTATDTRAMGGVSAELAQRLGSALVEQFVNKHIQASTLEAASASAEKLRHAEAALVRARVRFRGTSEARASTLPLQEFNISAELNEVWTALGAAKPDAVVLAFAFGRDTTRGGAIAGAVDGVFSQGQRLGANRLLIKLGIVDAATGRMLFFCEVETKEGVLSNSEPLHQALAKCVDAFRAASGKGN